MNGVILMGLLLVLMAIKIPVFISLLLSSLFYLLVLNPDLPMVILAQRMLGSMESFPLLALPLFILAADIMNSGRITDELFALARHLVGRVRGGLGHVNVIASVIFAGMSGSITADTAGLGKIEVAAMTKAGYDKSFAVAITGASSIIGPIIPPSIQMILYAMIAEQSVGRLFVGGVVPGLIMAVCLMITVYIFAVKKNFPRDERMASLPVIWKSFRSAVWALLTPVIILAGIVTGICTPTEAAVVAVVYAFTISFFVYRSITVRQVFPLIVSAALTSSLIVIITGAASVFGWIVTQENLPQLFQSVLSEATDKQWVVLLLLNVMFLIAGCFFDISAIILVFTPMIIPVLHAFNIDMVHWGVVEVLNVCIGFLTPPFGVGLFVLADLAGMTVGQVTRAIVPFLVPLLVALALITYIPQLVLWLPNLVFGVV